MPITTAVIGAGAKAASAIVNNTVDNLFKNKVYQAQVRAMDFKNRLSELTAEQQNALATRLQEAQNDQAKFKILQDANALIASAGVTGNATILSSAVGQQSKNSMNTVLIIGFSVIALIAAGYFLTKKN